MENILIIDNYDSFTYNLYHIIHKLNSNVKVVKNDKITLSDVEAFQKIVISPGPGIPDEAGMTKKIISHFKDTKDILGVCLGLQAIVEVFGGQLYNLEKVYHGVATHVEVVSPDKLFHDVPKVFKAGRYHSWAMDRTYMPQVIDIIAKDEHDEVMAIKIKGHEIRGVQFHPESILTPNGEKMIENWLH